MNKVKKKLRHFWRNNKKHIGMYFTLYCIAIAIHSIVLGDYISATYNVFIAIVWGIVWKQERYIDVMRRAVDVDDHNIAKEIESVRKKAFFAGYNAAKQTNNAQ